MRTSSLYSLAVALLALGAFAEVSFNSQDQEHNYNGVIPDGTLSAACELAYSETVECSPLLLQLRDSDTGPALFTQDNLKDLCTSDCIESLNDWDKSVNQACNANDKSALAQLGDAGQYLNSALQNRHSLQKGLYWSFCLKDSDNDDHFCLLTKNLPAFPTSDSDSDRFCNSNCRLQQALVITSVASDLQVETDIYNPSQCDNIDVDKLEMNAVNIGAFGSTGQINSTAESLGSSARSTLPGTSYDFNFFTSDAVNEAASKGNIEAPTTTGSSAAAKSSDADKDNVGARPVASWTAVAVVAALAAALI